MAQTKLVIGTTKRRSPTALAYVVRARRTPTRRRLIDTANALAIVLLALAGRATTSRNQRRTLATNGLGLDAKSTESIEQKGQRT